MEKKCYNPVMCQLGIATCFFTKEFTPFLKPLSAYSSRKLIIRRKVFNKEMIKLLVHHATLKEQPDPVRMHEYYKENFDYDPP